MHDLIFGSLKIYWDYLPVFVHREIYILMGSKPLYFVGILIVLYFLWCLKKKKSIICYNFLWSILLSAISMPVISFVIKGYGLIPYPVPYPENVMYLGQFLLYAFQNFFNFLFYLSAVLLPINWFTFLLYTILSADFRKDYKCWLKYFIIFTFVIFIVSLFIGNFMSYFLLYSIPMTGILYIFSKYKKNIVEVLVRL